MTSPAIVVLNAFLDSSDFQEEELSGLLWKYFWRDASIRRYLDVLFVILTAETQYTIILNGVYQHNCLYLSNQNI